MPIMGELLHVLDASREPWTPDLGNLLATHKSVQLAYPISHDNTFKMDWQQSAPEHQQKTDT